MSDLNEASGWGEYRRLIMAELERLGLAIDNVDRKIDKFRDKEIADIREKLADQRTEIGMLKVKAALIGLAFAAIPSIIATIVVLRAK